MGAIDAFWWVIDRATHELALFAAVGILLGGIDDLLVDLIWLARRFWRRATVYTRHRRANVETLRPALNPGRIAIFVPAWRESAVIAPMLAEALARFGNADYRIYVGCYPNDRATIDTLLTLARDPRIRLVINRSDGPTTKADNLNNMWRALLRDEAFGIM